MEDLEDELDPDDLTGEEVEQIEDELVDQASAARTIEELQAEIVTLTGLEQLYVIPRVVGDAVQAAIDVHDGPPWDDEFDALTITIDDSSAKDAKAQLKDLLKPTLASRELALVPPRRSGLNHPLFAKHVDEKGRRGNLLSLVGDRIGYVDSTSSPLCQLADLLAWVVRRRAANAEDELAARLYRLVRPRQHGIEGARGVRIMSMRSVPDQVGGYDHVAAWLRAAV